MFLTRFQINPQRRDARKLLASPQAMHAAVMAGFPDPPKPGTDGRVLWRIDHTESHQVLLYIASPTEPDLTHLVEQAGWPTTQRWQTRPYGPFLTSLQPGQQWAFRLTANPTRSGRNPRKNTENAPTQRFGHVTVAQQRAWILSRSEPNGFRIASGVDGEPDLIIHRRSTETFRRNGSMVTMRIATYDGRLEVTDPDMLRRTLVRGLGHGKAYGCGLLTLAPVQ